MVIREQIAVSWSLLRCGWAVQQESYVAPRSVENGRALQDAMSQGG